MELILLVQFTYLIFYFILAAQAAYYFLGYHKVLRGISLADFIKVRKSTDDAIRSNLKFFYIATLIIGIIVLLFEVKQPNISSALLIASLSALVIDIILAKKKNEPINATINQWKGDTIQIQSLQVEWLYYLRIRSYFISIGFLLLLLRVTIY